VEEKEYFEEKYKVSSYPELPICVVIPSYKNVANDRYKHNMNSILQQEYSNYHIVFIDDASEDETGRHVEMYIRENNISPDKITVVINQERMMAMPNIYKAAHDYCKPHEIFIIVDGDDELVGRQVFKHFNAIFSSHDVWVMYTNFISIRGSIGYSRPYTKSVLERNSFRKSAFVISHLRAFYTKLFTLIKEEDLRDEEGNWFRAANDVAMYLPILEMSKMRV
jgi:glycosyltransferase involved in cell wall biosynthesis